MPAPPPAPILRNETPFSVTPFIHQGAPVGPQLIVVVKACFTLAPGQPLAPIVPPPPPTGCVFAGEPETGECLIDNELAPLKPDGDVLVLGSCHAPGGRPLRSAIVELRFGGAVNKKLAVFGARTWRKGLFASGATDPEPFTSMPLSWSRAYGGLGFEANPAGCGKGGETGDTVPNIEDPTRPLAGRGKGSAAAGLGPLNPCWPGRRRLMGTYPSDWLKNHAPKLPKDFDWHFFNSAPADQRVPGGLKGDEEATLVRLHPAAETWTLRLPGLAMRCAVEDDVAVDGRPRRREMPLVLDTCQFEPDAGVLTLLWRGQLPVGGSDLACVHAVAVTSHPLRALLPPPAVLALLEGVWAPPQPAPEPPPPVPPPPASVPLSGAEAKAAPSLAGADLRKADLAGAELAGMDLSHACLAGARLVGAKLAGARLTGADLRQADLSGADLAGADLSGADLSDARLELATGAGALFDRARLDRARATGAKLAGASFVEASLAGAVFSRADLTGASLVTADARGLVAEDALMTNLRTAAGTDLTGARLAGISAAKSCWQHARLEGADLSEADLMDAILLKADLRGAKLRAADLTGASFVGANAQRADFSDAKCLHASFLEADLRNARFVGACCFEANLVQAQMDGADFAKADVGRTVRC